MTERLPVTSIRCDGGTQVRADIQEETIASYVEALGAGDVFPPITVYYDGADHWLADGFHRVEAHHRLSRETIDCNVLSGTRRDAVLHAVGANAEHGLRRSNEDKRRAIRLLLSDDEWSKKSDAWIADKCKVSDKTVAAVKRDLGFPRLTTVQSRDGRARPVRTPKTEPAETDVVETHAETTPEAERRVTLESEAAAGLTAAQWTELRPKIFALLDALTESRVRDISRVLRGHGKLAEAHRDLKNYVCWHLPTRSDRGTA